MMDSLDHLDSEEERIRTTYARRSCRDTNSLFHPGNLWMMQEQERRMLALLAKYNFNQLQIKRILDIGCGSGYRIQEFIKWGARPENLTGIDLLSDHIALAKQVCPDKVTFNCGNAARLDEPDNFFDLVIQSTVFTSILNAIMKQKIAAEMVRVLRPDGLILWYDFYVNNPRNPDVRGVNKQEIHRLFPGCQIDLERITLAPPLSRLLAPYSLLLCHLLGKIPFLCTHYLAAIRKPSV